MWFEPSRVYARSKPNLAAWVPAFEFNGVNGRAAVEEIYRPLDELEPRFLARGVVLRWQRDGRKRRWPVQCRAGDAEVQLVDRFFRIAAATQRLQLVDVG